MGPRDKRALYGSRAGNRGGRLCDVPSTFEARVDAPLMLEHLQTPEEYAAGRDYIRAVGDRIGVPFA